MNLLEKRIEYFTNSTVIVLSSLVTLSIVVRMVFFPYDVPITEDGLFYFRYAVDTSILGHLPSTPLSNNGWPLFVSVFFSIFHSNDFLDYMTLQRLISISISALTIIPVYLLTRRFFGQKYSFLGALLFAFEPRIIQNSLLGISEPLYILLITLSLFFFLSVRKNIIYLSFSVAALATQVRYEGIVLFFVISIMFFVKQKRERKIIIRYVIAIGIFVLTLLPMSYARTITMGSDGITDSVIGGGVQYGIEAASNQEDKLFGLVNYVLTGLQSLLKYFGLVMIPYFVFFVPLGIFLIFKNKNSNNFTMILAIIILSIPALYAYSRGIQETRYLYVLYPIFCVLSIFSIKFLQERIRGILLIIVAGIVISSILFLIVKNSDYEHEREAFEIAKQVSSLTKVINEYYPESKYVRVTGMIDKFPILSNSVSFGPKILPISYNSLEEFIEKNRSEGLDHIVVDGTSHRPAFLNDVFHNDSKHPFLDKEFDSKDLGFTYQVKIYRIDYDKFDFFQLNRK